jgi:hypothetical protein
LFADASLAKGEAVESETAAEGEAANVGSAAETASPLARADNAWR